MKKLIFCSLVAMSFLSGKAIAEGCQHYGHKVMAQNDQEQLIGEEQADPELLALLLRKKKEQQEAALETVVTYN